MTRKYSQDILKALQNMRPLDDTFMKRMFKNNKELAQLVLRIILKKPDLCVVEIRDQESMNRLAGARSICLDVYCTDAEGRKYNIEVQRAGTGANPKRARYHSSVMDIENLDKGQDFSTLPETYTIFITETDVFGKGKALYSIERINVTCDMPFDDGEHILYVNGSYEANDEIGLLMHDFRSSRPEDMYYPIIRDITSYLKTNEGGIEAMCRIVEEIAEQRAEDTNLKNLRAIIEKLNLTSEQAMELLNIPAEDRQRFTKLLK